MSDGTGFLRELLVATAAGSVSAIGTDPAVLGIGTDPAVRRAADLLPGRVKVAESPARARARFGGREAFGCIYTVAVPEFHTDPGEVAALVPLLAPDAALWVFDEAGPGEDIGALSMRVSTVLARGGFVIVDMLEHGSWIAVWAAAAGRDHG